MLAFLPTRCLHGGYLPFIYQKKSRWFSDISKENEKFTSPTSLLRKLGNIYDVHSHLHAKKLNNLNIYTDYKQINLNLNHFYLNYTKSMNALMM